jgi:hypothetical protein
MGLYAHTPLDLWKLLAPPFYLPDLLPAEVVAGVAEVEGLAMMEAEDTPVVPRTKNKWGNESVFMLLLHYCEHLGYL